MTSLLNDCHFILQSNSYIPQRVKKKVDLTNSDGVSTERADLALSSKTSKSGFPKQNIALSLHADRGLPTSPLPKIAFCPLFSL